MWPIYGIKTLTLRAAEEIEAEIVECLNDYLELHVREEEEEEMEEETDDEEEAENDAIIPAPSCDRGEGNHDGTEGELIIDEEDIDDISESDDDDDGNRSRSLDDGLLDIAAIDADDEGDEYEARKKRRQRKRGKDQYSP